MGGHDVGGTDTSRTGVGDDADPDVVTSRFAVGFGVNVGVDVVLDPVAIGAGGETMLYDHQNPPGPCVLGPAEHDTFRAVNHRTFTDC